MTEDLAPDPTPLSPDWWRNEAILTTPLRDLVDGLDTVGSSAIPYAQLPRRMSAYADEAPQWAHVAHLTPQALLLRPRWGASAVQALIDAAQQAVRLQSAGQAREQVGPEASATRLTSQLNDFDRTLLSQHVWSLDPLTQKEAAEVLGVSAISVYRNLPRARARFAEMLADPAHQEVLEHAQHLRQRLGPYLPLDVAELELRRYGLEPSSHAAQLLLHLAGPFLLQRNRWVERTTEAPGGRAQVNSAIAEVLRTTAAPSTETLLNALCRCGMSAGVALAYLQDQETLRRFGDTWVRWSNVSVAGKAEAALHAIGVAATAESIWSTIGDHRLKLTAVKARLSHDDRFLRTSRRRWALRCWKPAEYSGIAQAVGRYIDEQGGEASTSDIIDHLTTTIPDITESSIRTYPYTLEFVTEAGKVRRRTKRDGWPKAPPLHTVRGAFHNGDNEVRLAIPVTRELQRGSGHPIPPAAATALGINPGGRRTFTGAHGNSTVSWKPSSTTGANLGSLRAQALAVDATAGDTLLMVFRLDDARLDAIRIEANDSGLPLLRKLLGKTVRVPLAALASALQCQRDEVETILRQRGDGHLADLLTGEP